MRKLNNFEMQAYTLSTKKKYVRPSWEHTMKTYQGNGQTDWFLIGCTAFLVGFGIIGLIALT